MPPNEDEDRYSWEINGAIDPDDKDAVRSVILEYLAEGMLPDRISVSSFVSREDVHETYVSVLDRGMGNNDWPELADWLTRRLGSEFLIDSVEQRQACLSAYLDYALRSP